MRISLYLNDQLADFILPNQVSGSFSFDINPEEENKLINVEARDGKWVIYETSEVKIIENQQMVKSLVLKEDTFYWLQRENKNYIIYVNSRFIKNIKAYQYDQKLNILFGNAKEANLIYNIPYIKGIFFSIFFQNNKILLKRTEHSIVYVNKQFIKQLQYELKFGDEIEIYGLKIWFFNGLIFINQMENKTFINEKMMYLVPYLFPEEETPKNVEVKDVNLYEKDDYFSKSPRLRRIIETKKIKFSSPPNDSENQELPLILTIGPMLTMGVMSGTMLLNTLMRINSNETTFAKSWPQLVTGCTMLISMLLWPLATKHYNKKVQKKKKEELIKKYNAYLAEKEKDLYLESTEQKEILFENLITVDQCLENIKRKGINFWDKRSDQSDFLVVRLGIGKVPLDVDIQYSEEDFTIEESELKEKADQLVEQYKYIENAPVSYSFFENKTTAIMGFMDKANAFMNNILLQLISFYNYEDLKIVLFTNEKKEKNWKYLKYLNHNFNNERLFRFYGTDTESIKNVSDYISAEINNRIKYAENEKRNLALIKPYYFIIIDDYESVKHYEFIKLLTEMEENIGFSLVIMEDRLSKLPSKCNNFITIGTKTSGVLKNSYEKQEQMEFFDEIKYDVDMMKIAQYLSNIPIEFEESVGQLPDSINFLEMEKVGKVEQLNVLARWNSNDSTNSLRAEIGVDELGNLMYLDLHEKYHGPHGLIAGMTGSGKSEFIITYIISMAINYSPDDVAFILIDYKGGGLAGAFENSVTGVYLPHLAGTITNLDKAEMDRTLVSIDSEIKRRQKAFNDARDQLGESTIDIYKYQRFYKEGKLKNPIPHLFIICDEFAELKSQQPEFMDNLISVARIGRSLGVHLILATQKPSGVVNDQIWSNSKFRVCLKVQSASDSKEMIKRPEAASLKQAGRYYLQVGFDEYFALGQSGWCGAKYYPSEKIVKQVDKSVNFINDCGIFIKSIQGSTGIKIEPQGEQLAAILKSVIDISNMTGKKVNRLWLENIPAIILENALERKYNVKPDQYHVEAILGEYDAPESQKQGLVKYDFVEDGNTIIYGNDGAEREMFLSTLIYSSCKNHTVEEVNYYIVDYGSESLRMFQNLPHVGGMVFMEEIEKFNNLLKMIRGIIQKRKSLFSEYGGEYKNYIKNSDKKLPLIVVIFNNYDSIKEAYPNLYDDLPNIVRDSERYGIIFILSANAINSVSSKLIQNFSNTYALKLKSSSDYSVVLDARTRLVPRDLFGRGLCKIEGVHEFQVASIVKEEQELSDYVVSFASKQKEINMEKAEGIPVLPDFVRFEDVKEFISKSKTIPIGIIKNGLEIYNYNFMQDLGTLISSNKIENTIIFMKSLLQIINKVLCYQTIIIDPMNLLQLDLKEYPNYYVDSIEENFTKLIEYIQNLIDSNSDQEGFIVIFGFSKTLFQLQDPNMIKNFTNVIKKYEKINVIVVEKVNKIKQYTFEPWYKELFNSSNGIWIGRGFSDQTLFRYSNFNKGLTLNYKNDMGFVVNDGLETLCRMIDFFSEEVENDEE